jgi:6-phosphofructo-2-kinase/fructose-2,6-biphosphatase 2
MVGLPARGKTYIAKKLTRYLNWIGVSTRVFNAGDYRRQAHVEMAKKPKHSFFDPNNAEASAIREACMEAALSDALSWIREEEGKVAIFDATNTTRERRRIVYDKIVNQNGMKCMFLESICNSDNIVESNVREVKVHSPDYKGVEAEEAITDFLERIKHYEDIYEPISEETENHFAFIKIFNAGEKYVIHKHEGYLQSKIVYWIMNVHITPRTIYLTRHGESIYNITNRIGGDSDLTVRGQHYGKALSYLFNQQLIPGLRVWTSWLKRTIQTAEKIQAPQERWRALNEIDAGDMENLTYEEMEEKFPEEFKARDASKLTYRYPSGESYQDLVARLEPVMMELERQGNVLLVGHQAVIRCILGYFLDKPLEELPYIKVPLHTLIKLTPQAYGCEAEFIRFPIEANDTYRPKEITPGPSFIY